MQIPSVNCYHCERPRHSVPVHEGCDPCKRKLEGAVVYVVHDGYGCDTGCCGHRLYIEAADGTTLASEFDFYHCDLDDATDWAGRVAAKYGIGVAHERFDIRPNC